MIDRFANRHWVTLFLGMAVAVCSWSAEVIVAVAANFTVPMKHISQQFEQETGHQVVLAFGSTGKFYAQIKQGAPFHVLVAGDQITPSRLVDEQVAVKGTQFTYAIGELVLWSAVSNLLGRTRETLIARDFNRIAVANPKLAPYGRAGYQVLQRLGLLEVVRDRLVQGENISQAYQFVATENAELGFVALSQVLSANSTSEESFWRVPQAYYEPIKQDAALLNKGLDNPAAGALLDYLRGDKARKIIRSFGYKY